jgi:hypothetical protein
VTDDDEGTLVELDRILAEGDLERVQELVTGAFARAGLTGACEFDPGSGAVRVGVPAGAVVLCNGERGSGYGGLVLVRTFADDRDQQVLWSGCGAGEALAQLVDAVRSARAPASAPDPAPSPGPAAHTEVSATLTLAGRTVVATLSLDGAGPDQRPVLHLTDGDGNTLFAEVTVPATRTR